MSLQREIVQEYVDWFRALPERKTAPRSAEPKVSFGGILCLVNHMTGLPVPTGWHKHYQENAWYLTKGGYAHGWDCPSIVYDDYGDFNLCWFVNGKAHREDGPATIDLSGGAILTRWKWYGNDLDLNEWLQKTDLSQAEKVEIKMVWG